MDELMKKLIKFSLIICFSGLALETFAQDDEAYYEKLLSEEVKVENPVYKPVVGIAFGTLNFYGDVHNAIRNPFVGMPSLKINAATFLDKKHYVRANFYVMLGTL